MNWPRPGAIARMGAAIRCSRHKTRGEEMHLAEIQKMLKQRCVGVH
jgi:hypothetical protein